MTSHLQRCDRTTDRNDVIAFIKYAGFDVELAKRTDGVEELTITGFDNAGDMYLLDFTPCASHSDFQSEREKVLDELVKWCKKKSRLYGADDSKGRFANDDPCNSDPFECVLKKIEELRKQGGEQ